ncbi:MAG: porin family protein [Holophagaceae bacterium]|nr:porin family protein [Holophagaceae bacterium]
MIKKLCTLCILGATSLGLVAQDSEKPLYVGVTMGFSQTDLRDYQGGKTGGHGFELGYDFTKPEDFVGIRVFGRYTRWSGDYIETLELQQNLMSWGVGAEFTFQTPVEGLRPYLGAGFMWWDGRRDTESDYLARLRASNFPQYFTYNGAPLPPGPHPEGQQKLGLRAGVNYNVWKDFSVALEYNLYTWKNNSQSAPNTNDLISPFKVNGYNRVFPAWIGLTLKYHFPMAY